MPPVPHRIRKPLAAVRPGRSVPRRAKAWRLPPALVSAVALGSIGAAAWWLMQPPAAPLLPLEEGVPSSGAAVPAESAPALAAAPQPAPAAAATPVAESIVAPPAAAPPTGPTRPPLQQLLVFDSLRARQPEHAAWRQEAFRLAKQARRWDEYRDLLEKSLQAFAAKGMPTAAVVAGEHSGPALIRHAFLSAVPGPALAPLLEQAEAGPFVSGLLDQPESLEAFLRQLSPLDDVAKALSIWAGIAAEEPSALGDYRELAIACALVFDQRVKVAHDRYGAGIDPLTRFRYFRDSCEAGRLTGRIRQQSAGDLVWAVGVPVAASELEWALKKANFRRQTWGLAYGSIKYDMEKAVTGKSSYVDYTFAEIAKKGGICGDQAYFSAWTACAHGIPAVILTGDGSRGPHAWMAWLGDGGEWKFAGRLGGYPAGRSRNPQTGESISEEALLRLNDRKAASPEQVLRARQALWLAGVFRGDAERAAVYLAEAGKAAPRLADPAAALLAHWVAHRGSAPVEEWITLLRDLREDFRDLAPLMAKANAAEETFVFARQATAAAVKSLRREARKVDDTASAGSGVAVDPKRLADGLRRQAVVLQSSGNAEGIRSLYRRALDDHGDNPASFKALAQDYFSFCKADASLANKVCFELESTCRRNVGRGQGDWFDVLGQNSAWMVVAKCYRSAGNSAKADLIARDCATRERVAKKRAL